MNFHLGFKMNEALYLRNPESSELGKKIIQYAIILIQQDGFESFTFKKLALEIGTTEASVYRYFENKHRLLIYLIAWYWYWLKYQITFHTNNIQKPKDRLLKVVRVLASPIQKNNHQDFINEVLLHKIVIYEGAKVYLTNHVSDDNKKQLFKPYKDLCAVVGEMILACNPQYPYPRSLASTVIEMAHFQIFFMNNLPSLTDFEKNRKDIDVIPFLENLVFKALE